MSATTLPRGTEDDDAGPDPGVKKSTGHTHTDTAAERTTAEQTTHTNTERATAQRRLIVEVVKANRVDPNISKDMKGCIGMAVETT